MTGARKLGGDWSTVTTLKHQRTEGGGDVLLGTTAGGQLREWRVSSATVSSTVLQESGWEAVTGLGVGVCDFPGSRVLLGIAADGSARVEFTTSHGAATDDLGSLGWIAKVY